MEYREEIQNAANNSINYACRIIEFDIAAFLADAAQPGPKTMNIALYDLQKQIMNAYSYIQSDKHGMALYVLRPVMSEILSGLKSNDADWLIENIAVLSECVEMVKATNVAYDTWVNTDFELFLDGYRSHNIFKDGEITSESVGPDFMENMDETIKLDLLKAFKYKDGKEPLKIANRKFKMNEQIYMSDSLQEFMDYLKRFQSEDDIVYVNIMMKIEAREDMSFFVITFTCRDHVWILTDMGFDFRNPKNKDTTRNARRRREKFYDNVGLPYGFIDQLDNIRKNSKQTKRFDDQLSMELHMSPVIDLPPYNKMFLLSVSEHYINYKLDDTTEKIYTFEDHINQKLLTGPTIDISVNDAGFIGWNDHIRAVAEDAINTVNKNSTDLVRVSHEVITSHELYDRNWLGTADQLENIARWTVLNTQAEDMQNKLDALAPERKPGIDAINKLINAPGNLERLLPYIFSGKDAVYYTIDNALVSEDSKGHGFWQINGVRHCKMKYNNVSTLTDLRLGFDHVALNERLTRWHDNTQWFERRSDYLWRPKCQCCNKYKVSTQFFLNVIHYEQLMFLCNVETQDELPIYFQTYRDRSLIPYHGNSILDNVHPYAMLKHPAWRHYESGLKIDVMMCGGCANKFSRKYAKGENSLIDSDGEVKKYDPNNKSTMSYHFC